jgi:hypothetical protein
MKIIRKVKYADELVLPTKEATALQGFIFSLIEV